MRYVQTTVHRTLHSSKDPCSGRGACKSDVEVATEGTWLAVDRLHLVLLASYILTAAVYAVQFQPLQQLISIQQVTVYFHKSSLPRHSIVFSCVKPLVFLRLHWTVIQLSWTHAYTMHLVGVCVCVSEFACTNIDTLKRIVVIWARNK